MAKVSHPKLPGEGTEGAAGRERLMSWKDRRIESAAIDVHNERDSRGLSIYLCNPMNPDSVKAAIVRTAGCFEPGAVFINLDGCTDPNASYVAARHLRKLATLLEAHLS